jgi:branched-chain amino acid transport system permease protein
MSSVLALIDVTTAIRYIVDGITLGSTDALIALGLALIFGMMNLINFAHGELMMAGAYALLVLMAIVPWAVAVPIMLFCIAGLALIMERAAFRPVRKADPMTLLVTSFALSYLLQNLAILSFGSRAKSLAGLPQFLNASFTVAGVDVPNLDVITVGTTVVVVASLATFLTTASLGLQMLAAARDFDMARLLGVRANRVIATAFAISGVLAGAVAFVLVAQTGIMTPDMGVQPLLVAFAGTIIGGMGSLIGATIGGFTLGFITTMLQAGLPLSLRPFRDAFVFGVVILFLLIRPRGLIPGRATVERV